MELEICKRTPRPNWGGSAHRYHVQIKDQPSYWGTGASIEEAIGDLVNSHRYRFCVKITFLEKVER